MTPPASPLMPRQQAHRSWFFPSIFFRRGGTSSSRGNNKPPPPMVRTFVQLAQERQFGTLVQMMAQQESPGPSSATWFPSPEKVLHVLCRYQPTEAVVRAALLRASSYSADLTVSNKVDAEGRTALHIAVAHGASAAVVRLLARHEKLAAAVPDRVLGRYPLHYACCVNKAGGAQRRNGSKQAIENSLNTVRILLEAHPQAVTAKDRSGLTPLDLALKQQSSGKNRACIDARILVVLRSTTTKTTMENSNKINTSIAIKNSSSRSKHNEEQPSAVATVTDGSSSRSAEQLPPREVIPYYNNEGRDGARDGDNDSDLSSLGSRGVSRHLHRTCFNSELIEC